MSGTSKLVYQRQIPLFIISAITALFTVEYFLVPIGVLTTLHDELLTWSVIIAGVTMLYAQVMLMMGHARRLIEFKVSRKWLFRSGVFYASFALFLLLGISSPETVSAPLFVTMYGLLITRVAEGINTCGWPAQINAVFRMFRITSLESLVIVSVYFLTWLRNLTVVTVYIPEFIPLHAWIGDVPYAAAQRAALIGAAVSTIIISVRALVGKEPGLMELEVT